MVKINNPRPIGKIQGDSNNIPDRGTSVGFYAPVKLGMDIGTDATNSYGSFNAESDCAEVACRQNKGRM